MNIKEDLKKRILSKIEEGYNEGGRLVETGEVALYPEPAPTVDPTVQGSGKTLQVDSDLLRDLLNWATSADAGSIDAVVAKAEEMGVGAPLTPAQLVDLTATAHTADPSNPTVSVGTGCNPEAAPGVTSPVVPAGPVGPLSPVMASFMRRGKKVEELVALPKMDKSGAVQVKTAQQPGKPAPLAPDKVAQLARAEKKAKAAGVDPGEMTLYGNEADTHDKPEDLEDHSDDQTTRHEDDGEREDMFDSEQQMKEDDIIDSDNEVITQPEQMGKKNPGIKPDGGQRLPDDTTRPIGKLNDPANLGGKGLAEDGVEDEAGGVEDAAAAIAGGIADGLAGDTIETEPEVNALPGEGIPQNDDDAAINAELGAPVAPPVGEPVSQEGGEGLVGQVAALQARVAELEALLGGTAAEAPEAEIEVGGEEGEDELAIDGEEGEEDEEDEEAGEENGEEAEENGEEEEDDEESDEEGEASDDEKENDEAGEDEDEEGKKLLLGDEEEEKK